jgi:splicing suppressor protein 51
MSGHQEKEMPIFIPTSNPHIQEEVAPTVAEMYNRQDDEMSVDSVPHEEKASVTASSPLDGNMDIEEEAVPFDQMVLDEDEVTSVITSTSPSFDLASLLQSISSVAETALVNNTQHHEIDFSDDETDFMKELREQLATAGAGPAQQIHINHEEVETEQQLTVAEALLLSELEISTSNGFQMLSIIEHLIQSVTAIEQGAPLLLEIEHNVDTYAFVKLRNGKKQSDTDNDDTPEKITPHTACARCGCQHDPAANEPALTLLTCDNCKAVQYCSIMCQHRDWKAHRNLYCVNPINIPVDILAKPHKAPFLMTTIANPFARLSEGTWLHDRHQQDVYVLLIDSFRLREYDDFTFGGTSNADSVYSGRPSSCPAFRRFLCQAEAKGLMPPWWTDHTRVECLTKGADRSADNWHDLHAMARDIEVVVVYEAAIMAMQLRMFAETVLGSGAAGTDGRLMLQHMVVIEEAARDIAAKEKAAQEGGKMEEE